MNGNAMQGVDLDSISQTGCGSRRSPLSPTTCGPCSEVFPEAASSGAAKEQWTRQTQDAALKLSNSNAFSNLAQGLMNNYLHFWTDLSQSLVAGFSQGQSSLMRQAEAVTSEAIDAT